MKNVKCNKKNRKNVKTEGRDETEIQPEDNINTDKTAKTYSEYQKRPQSKSVRYTKSLARPYRAPRTGMKGVRKKKI